MGEVGELLLDFDVMRSLSRHFDIRARVVPVLDEAVVQPGEWDSAGSLVILIGLQSSSRRGLQVCIKGAVFSPC